MVSISKSSWDSLGEEDQSAVVDRLRKRNLLGKNEQIITDPDLEPMSFDHVDISGVVLGGNIKKCRKRCSKFAEFMYRRCIEEGGTPRQCDKAAEADYKDCREEGLKESQA